MSLPRIKKIKNIKVFISVINQIDAQNFCFTIILCIKLVNYWDKYTEMHGQQNFRILRCFYDDGEQHEC